MNRLQLYCRQSGETPPGRRGKNIPLSPAERFMTTVNKCNKQRRGTQLILITGVSVSDKKWHSILGNVHFAYFVSKAKFWHKMTCSSRQSGRSWWLIVRHKSLAKLLKVGELSKETTIADGHNHPLLLVLRAWLGWAGGGRFRMQYFSQDKPRRGCSCLLQYYTALIVP